MPESDMERRGRRIRVSQKKSDETVLIQQIQLLALKHGLLSEPTPRIDACIATRSLLPIPFRPTGIAVDLENKGKARDGVEVAGSNFNPLFVIL